MRTWIAADILDHHYTYIGTDGTFILFYLQARGICRPAAFPHAVSMGARCLWARGIYIRGIHRRAVFIGARYL